MVRVNSCLREQLASSLLRADDNFTELYLQWQQENIILIKYEILLIIDLLVVIFLPLMILVEVDTERKFPMPPPPPPPPPKEEEEKEVKPPPPRLPIVVMCPMWPIWPMVFMEPKEPKPEMRRTENTLKSFWDSLLLVYFFFGRFLTWIKRRETSTKGRKPNKAPEKWPACPVAICPTLVPPPAAEKWIITKWIWTWAVTAEERRVGEYENKLTRAEKLGTLR